MNEVKEYRTWLVDSRRWQHYSPRKNDVIVTTYPKSGTTWMQRIVSLLIFQNLDPVNLDRLAPWLERRTGPPIRDVIKEFDKQSHQREIKTHLPFDGLPIYEEVRYIHVVRDGRDIALSYHNHCNAHRLNSMDILNKIGMEDETIQKPYPDIAVDPAEFFHNWLRMPAINEQPDGSPFLSYFQYEKSYAKAFGLENILFVRFADLLTDLVGEMRKIADFLEIHIEDRVLERLSHGAGFKQMQKDGEQLIPLTVNTFSDGAKGFFNKGESGLWRDVFKEEDLVLFEEKQKEIPCSYLTWMQGQ